MSDSSPFDKHPQLVDLEDKYELVSTIWGGTPAMRDASTDYLPREPAEEPENYARRLNRTVLFPGYKNAIIANTGKLFANGIDIENASPALADLMFQIDEDNDNIELFGERATISGMHYGCSYILVDYPVMNDNATLADERAAGAQPYWVLIEAPLVLEASPIYRNGRKALGVFRYKERVAFRSNEFTVSYVEQVKEFRINDEGTVTYRVWRKVDNKDILIDEGSLFGMEDIPVAPLYTNKVGFYLGSPTMIDLAYENILNWQINSDYQNIVHHSQVPMLAITGMTSEFDDNGIKQEIVISPNTVLEFSNPNGKAEWVEVAGSASNVGRQAILDSYDRMSTLSLEGLQSNEVTKTATEVTLDAAESTATIRLIEQNIELALEQAIDFTYQYLQIPNPGTRVDLIIEADEDKEEENENNEPAAQTSTSSGDDE